MSNFILDSLWPGLSIWIILYISDYILTLKCARLYKAGVSDKIAIEGSFELTPFFQQDIDSLRLVSPRFLLMLFVTVVGLTAVWLFTAESERAQYNFLLGAAILVELTVHMRHLRNLAMFRGIINSDAVRGRIEYSRQFILGTSASELFAFSGLFFLLFVFTSSSFILGGAAGCLLQAIKHRRLRRLALSSTISPKPQPIAQ